MAAVSDARRRRIPNALTVPAALLGLAYTRWPPGLGTAGVVGRVWHWLWPVVAPWLLGGGGMETSSCWRPGRVAWTMVDPDRLCREHGRGSVMALAVMLNHSLTQGVSKASRRFLLSGERARRPRNGPLRALPFAVPVALSTWAVLAWLVRQGGF